LWGTLNPDAMVSAATDLAFKYGPSIPGDWIILGVMDAKPFDFNDEIKLPVGLGDLERGMLQMALQLKAVFGRSTLDYGITPLAIYRKVPLAAVKER